MLDSSRNEFEDAKRMAAELFNQTGQISFPFCLIRWHEGSEVRHQVLKPFARKGRLGPDGNVTELEDEEVQVPPGLFAQLIRRVASDCRADLSILIMEAWIGHVEAETTEQAVAERARYGKVEDMPNRREAVCIVVEDRSGQEMWNAAIIRGDKTARLTEFTRSGYGGGLDGRMANLLPPGGRMEVN